MAIDRRGGLSIEQNGYQQIRMALQNRAAINNQNGYRSNRKPSIEQKGFDRIEWLSIDQIGYQQNRFAIDRTEQLLIEQNRNGLNIIAIDRTE